MTSPVGFSDLGFANLGFTKGQQSFWKVALAKTEMALNTGDPFVFLQTKLPSELARQVLSRLPSIVGGISSFSISKSTVNPKINDVYIAVFLKRDFQPSKVES
jgi:precorrin-6B methylase 1